MDGTVVELDALADADRAGSDDDCRLAGRCDGFVLDLVGGVEVGGAGGKLGGAGVDHLEDGGDLPLVAQFADAVWKALHGVGKGGDLRVGEAASLGIPEEAGGEWFTEEALLEGMDACQAVEEPGVDAGVLVELGDGDATAQRGHECPEADVVWGVDQRPDAGQPFGLAP